MEYALFRVLPDDRPDGLYNITDIPVSLRYGDGTYGVDGTVALASFQMGAFNESQQGALLTSSSNQYAY
jgi:saccharopepsin